MTTDNERRERFLLAQKKQQQTKLISRRTYLTLKAMMVDGVNIFLAREAVATTALEHPEWDMDEEHTWTEWEGRNK